MASKDMKEITSPQNSQYKYWLSLTKGRGLKDGKHFLLSGQKLVQEIMNDSLWKNRIVAVLMTKDQLTATTPSDLDLFPSPTLLAAPLFESIDVLGTHTPILVLEQPEWPQWQSSSPIKGLQLFCPLGDPQNLGALLRSAYAFGVAGVVILREAAHPLLPKAIKASAGAVLKIPLALGPSIKDLKSPVVGLDLNGTPLQAKKWPQDLGLLIGEEGPGIPESFQGERMTLPMKNPIESLNAAVAASIAIYHLSQR